MSRRGVRVVVVFGLSIVAWAGTATAQNEAPESPPAAFVPPPPGYEPPQQYPPSMAAEPAAPAEEDILPGFMTLDRQDAHSRVGIQIGFHKVDDVDLSDAFFMRFNGYGQYVFPGKAGGIYGQIPMSHAFVFEGDGEDATGWGNLEMGGFFMPMRSNDLILRVGLVAATASDTGLDSVVNAVTAYERLTDIALVIPNYTTARVSASTVQRFGQGFLRADGGFDFVIDRPGGMGDDPSVFLRANVAAGVRVPGVDFAFELANLAFVNGDVTGGITERFNHTAAITARTPGVNQLHFGMVFPLDADARGEVWILSFGYQRATN